MAESCSGFEPQNYLRDRCKKCFRLRSKHEPVESATSAAPNTSLIKKGSLSVTVHSPSTPSTSAQNNPLPSSPQAETNPSRRNSSGESNNNLYVTKPPLEGNMLNNNGNFVGSNGSLSSSSFKKEKRRSWRDKNFTNNNDEGPDFEDATDSISLSSYKTANSKGGMSSGKSMESVNSNMDCRSMVTAMSSSLESNHIDEDRAVTPTDAFEFFDQDVTQLRAENVRLRQKVQTLEEEAEGGITLRRNSRNDITVNDSIEQKLRESGLRCSKLTTENETLKSEVHELQQEIEEMQDQYREEEIDEFRELQRELEQNAKNCRILQFKLRKSDRQREQLQSEKNHIASKLLEFQANGSSTKSDESGTKVSSLKDNRIRELESELRVAKEVSVRLHSELETAEDKRYKMEDEIFYYKEKLRELQAQNKWRENRIRAEQITKRQSVELSEAASLSNDEACKELRDVLERETDLKDQLRFTEEDLRRTQARLQDVENENEELMQKLLTITDSRSQIIVNKPKPPMVRSVSEGNSQTRLTLSGKQQTAEGTARHNSTCDRTKTHPTSPLATNKHSANTVLLNHADPEIETTIQNGTEKEMAKLLSNISELRKKNNELQCQMKQHQSDTTQHNSSNKEKALAVELRKEQEHVKELTNELADYKQLIAKSENNRLIAMATKVEVLSNQLAAANERCANLHKRVLKDCSTNDQKYADTLKIHCEALEKQIGELKSKDTFQITKQSNVTEKNLPSSDEIEQCCVLLASVDVQTSRILKQLEKLDMTSQKEERRRSLSKDNYAVVVADLANVMTELKMLHTVLETAKVMYQQSDQETKPAVKEMPKSKKLVCLQCPQKEKTIAAQKEDIDFYKKKNKELTNQILQTEERWSTEIDKVQQEYEAKIRLLNDEIKMVKEQLREHQHVNKEKETRIAEKDRLLDESESKVSSLKSELNDKHRQIMNLEKERKSLKEWETKHKTLEAVYEKEKKKFDAERSKVKAEATALKKRTDEAVAELDKLRDGHQRREIMWIQERANLEDEIQKLKQVEEDMEKNTTESPVVRTIPIRTINYRVTKISSESSGIPELKQKISVLEKQNEELEGEVLSLRSIKDQMETELDKTRQVWEKEKDNITHKTRQDEKIRNVELEAMQQKFNSRLNIMEQTNKNLHTQLVQSRRERDLHKEAVSAYEKKIVEEKKLVDAERKKCTQLANKTAEMEKKIQELTEIVDRLTREISLSKEAHSADKKLWSVEKAHLIRKDETKVIGAEDKDRRIAQDALDAAENVQKKYAEYQKFHAKEVGRLKNRIKELIGNLQIKEDEFNMRAKELAEQIKVLEIDQRNLIKAKEMQTNAKETMQADQERLMKLVHKADVSSLTRKYKIASVIEQLKSMPNARYHQYDHDIVLSNILNQLNSLKDDAGSSSLLISETNDAEIFPSDTLSQSSISVRSTPQVPTNAAYNRYGQFNTITANNRSYSTESSTTWDSRLLDCTARSVSPVKKSTYPDPPPNFILNKDKVAEYDRSGRLHYVPKTMSRSISYDRYGNASDSSYVNPQMKSTGTLTESHELDDEISSHSRMGSTGTNILYKIRREELAKGSNPSVKTMAKAFETLGQKGQKRGFFSMRKSRSVDTEADKPRQNASNMSTADVTESSNLHFTRGGRNPFKNMGSRLVEKVRRSLSRSSRRGESEEKLPASASEELALPGKDLAMKLTEKPPLKAIPTTKVKMRVKVKKANAEQLNNDDAD
ncbi:microtubule cross-linking factor 1 [Ditylenchus destructor]|nr:microtubule cross-linking factor 1 [Ditylenchus destructor]